MTLDEALGISRGDFFRADGDTFLCLAPVRDFGGTVGWCLRGGRVSWYEITAGNAVETRTLDGEWVRLADVERVLHGQDEVMAEHLRGWLASGGESLG